MIYSSDDDVGPSERLVSVALEAIGYARDADLDQLGAREAGSPRLANQWPGEHYRLLAGIVSALKPRLVVEIGTGSGLSALTMLSAIPSDARLVSFDIVPWKQYPGGVLRDQDFADGRLEQLIEDLTSPEIAEDRGGLLAQADFVFADAAKDGVQEERFLRAIRQGRVRARADRDVR